jgi:lipoate-protein ligase A
MSNIAELRALEEFLMEEEELNNSVKEIVDVVKEVEKEDIVKNIVENIVEEAVKHVVPVSETEITISDEEATKLIEKIKELSVYEEMSDEDDKSSIDEQKKSVWSAIREMMNRFQSFLSSKQ